MQLSEQYYYSQKWICVQQPQLFFFMWQNNSSDMLRMNTCHVVKSAHLPLFIVQV